MSDQKCFTVKWTIENFSNFSGTAFEELKSPTWHMMTHVGSGHFHLGVHFAACKVIFQLNNASYGMYDHCKMSLISTCGTIPLKREFSGRFSINRIDIFGVHKHLVLSSDTLTICCEIFDACINKPELRLFYVLYRIIYPWTIENFNSITRTSHKTSWKKDNFLFHIDLVKTGIITYTVTVRIEPPKGVFDFHLSDFKFYMIPYTIVIPGTAFSIDNVYHFPDQRTWSANFCISALCHGANISLQFECTVAVNKDNTTTTSSLNSIKTSTAYPILKSVNSHAVCSTSESVSTQAVCPTSESVKTKTVCPTSESLKTISPTVAIQDSIGTLTSDLLSILRDDTTLSDATLNTEGKSFSAHKIILSARSSVFKAMFEKEDTTEGRSGMVDIEDIDSETVQRLLVFLYGESLEDVQWDDASKLYYAADKYAVHLLKQKCSHILKAGLSVVNACDVIILADRHSDDELMKGAVDYVRDHKEIISSSYWEKLEECYPRLAAKILRQFFVKTTASYPTSEGIKNKSPTEAVQVSTGTLASDFLSLLSDTTFSDATLNTEGKSFSAHKIILAARSSVFKAMFEKEDTTEVRSRVVDIEDIDSETVQRLLVFLYGESLADLSFDDASKLYYAADKYAVLFLKQKCSNILKAGLSVSNACDAIILGDRHSDDELMKGAIDYIRNHQEVISSSDWENFEEIHSKLAAKILRQVFVKKSKN